MVLVSHRVVILPILSLESGYGSSRYISKICSICLICALLTYGSIYGLSPAWILLYLISSCSKLERPPKATEIRAEMLSNSVNCKSTYPAASSGVCCSHKVLVSGLIPLKRPKARTRERAEGIKPSPRINFR